MRDKYGVKSLFPYTVRYSTFILKFFSNRLLKTKQNSTKLQGILA